MLSRIKVKNLHLNYNDKYSFCGFLWNNTLIPLVI